jgi:glutathione synthase/RimK-type ligase-like ATP-grasp enzyme
VSAPPGGTPVVIVVDAPGGPTPATYLPGLLREFDVHVVLLAVGSPAARHRRRQALAGVSSVVEVEAVTDVPAATLRTAREASAQGIVALSERVVHIAQLCAGELGMPANSAATLKALQDKTVQRARLSAAGIAVPRAVVIPDTADVEELGHDLPYPAVLKPAIGMGSIATSRVRDRTELLRLVVSARKLVRADARIAHHRPPLLLEEEWEGNPAATRDGTRGDYVSVEVATSAGSHHVLAVQDKLPMSAPFRENGHLLPSCRADEEQRELAAYACSALTALGVVFGVTHTEIKLTREGPRIIEVNGRVGGGVCEMLRLAADYDMALELAHMSVDAGHVPSRPRVTRYAAYLTPQPPSGRWRVDRAPTADELVARLGVEAVVQLAVAGDVVDAAEGTASNLLRLFAAASEQEALADLGRWLQTSQAFQLAPADVLPPSPADVLPPSPADVLPPSPTPA